MPAKNRLIIGTRGSRLSLAQTALVADALRRLNPELAIETKVITTTGDIDQSPIPLDTVGKNWFTGEIEQALIKGEIDLAIHSLKDMSLGDKPGLTAMTVLERADPRDALISKSELRLDDLPKGAIVGTDSIRRKVLLLDRRPDLIVKSIRGNVDTRIRKMHEESHDAIVLAAAGLERLGMLDAATEIFDATAFPPAPGQGVLAAQARADADGIIVMLRGIQHMPTQIAADAELAFSRAAGGGCKTPVGCYAKVGQGVVSISAVVGDLADNRVTRRSAEGPAGEAVRLATELAAQFA